MRNSNGKIISQGIVVKIKTFKNQKVHPPPRNSWPYDQGLLPGSSKMKKLFNVGDKKKNLEKKCQVEVKKGLFGHFASKIFVDSF